MRFIIFIGVIIVCCCCENDLFKIFSILVFFDFILDILVFRFFFCSLCFFIVYKNKINDEFYMNYLEIFFIRLCDKYYMYIIICIVILFSNIYIIIVI